MIDTTKKYWTGSSIDDIDEYLRLYSENDDLDIKTVQCHSCGSKRFEIKADPNEGVIQVKCIECGTQKILLDGEDYWKECKCKTGKCPICKNKWYHVRIGFGRREDGTVKWVYIGNRCENCGTLGSYADWKVNYKSAEHMEKNI